MSVLAALTPVVVIVVAIVIAVAALVRREMAPKRGHDAAANGDISADDGISDGWAPRSGVDSTAGAAGERSESDDGSVR